MLVQNRTRNRPRTRRRDGLKGRRASAILVRAFVTPAFGSLSMVSSLSRRRLVHATCAALLLIGCAVAPRDAGAQSKEPILVAVTGPLTGQYAQYGVQWKKGFDLALDEI